MGEGKKVSISYSDIPDVPGMLLKVLDILKDKAASVSDIRDLMCYDKPLVEFFVKLVNSKYFNFEHKIAAETVEQALIKINIGQARNIVLLFLIEPFLHSYEKECLWAHSIRTAVGCKKLAMDFNVMSPEDAFVLGLMHDVGKIILNNKDAQLYTEVLKCVENGENIFNVEDRCFGINHSDVGFFVAKKWQCPKEVIEGIKFHHLPEKSENAKAAFLVYLADSLSLDNFDENILDKSVFEILDIELKDIHQYREQIFEISKDLLSLF